jgi:hypothetical protein
VARDYLTQRRLALLAAPILAPLWPIRRYGPWGDPAGGFHLVGVHSRNGPKKNHRSPIDGEFQKHGMSLPQKDISQTSGRLLLLAATLTD